MSCRTGGGIVGGGGGDNGKLSAVGRRSASRAYMEGLTMLATPLRFDAGHLLLELGCHLARTDQEITSHVEIDSDD